MFGRFMNDNRRRLLTNRWTSTFIGLDVVLRQTLSSDRRTEDWTNLKQVEKVVGERGQVEAGVGNEKYISK